MNEEMNALIEEATMMYENGLSVHEIVEAIIEAFHSDVETLIVVRKNLEKYIEENMK